MIFLEQLNNHENIIKLTSVIKAENNKDLYMVFDYMETDLHKVWVYHKVIGYKGKYFGADSQEIYCLSSVEGFEIYTYWRSDT